MKIVREHKEVLEPDYIGAEAGFILSIGNFPSTIKIKDKESMAWIPHMGIWNLQEKAIEVGHIFLDEKGKDLTTDGTFGAKLNEKDFLRIVFIPSSYESSTEDILYTFKEGFILEDGSKQDILSVLAGPPEPRHYFNSDNRLYTSHLRKKDLLDHIGLYVQGCKTIGYGCEHSDPIGLHSTKTGEFDKKWEDVKDFVCKLKPKLEERFNIKF